VFFVGANNTVEIELPASFSMVRATMCDNSSLKVYRNAGLSNVDIVCKDSNLTIGKGTTMYGAFIRTNDGRGCTIGEDCMFSSDIAIWSQEGHSILDAKTGKILNRSQKGPLEIGDHCWIGFGVRITKNVRIPNDTIVGMGAVVVKEFTEPHTAIAGNPARVVKRGVTWDRRNIAELEKSRRG
jgi:acetyltransferase-like isoleucine patch superfamily enzyme